MSEIHFILLVAKTLSNMATFPNPTRLLSFAYPHKTHCVTEAMKVNSTAGADKAESGD